MRAASTLEMRRPDRAAETRGPGSRHRLWIVVLVGGLALFVLLQQTALYTDNARLLPGMVLFGALVAPATSVAFLWPRIAGPGMFTPITPTVGIAVGLGGGAVGIMVAAVLENLAGSATGNLSALAVGVIEEGAKLIVPAAMIISLRAPVSTGLALGVASGAGFALIETLGYIDDAYLASGNAIAVLDADLLSRSLFTPATHLAWTGITAAALAALVRCPAVRTVVLFVAVSGIAVLLHTVWDLWSTVAVYAALSAIGLTLLYGALHLARRICSPADQR